MSFFMKPLDHLHDDKPTLRETRKKEKAEKRLYRRYLRVAAINSFLLGKGGDPLFPSYTEWRQEN